MQRRDFLIASAATAAPAAPKSSYPKRPYKAGIELSVIGFGGIVVVGQSQPDADKEVVAAFERGINYFDCAPTYANGEAELKLGAALRPYRDKIFLAGKTTQRDAAGARAELEQSLQRFHTDHFDLYQFHAVGSLEDVDKILAPGGAAETFTKAKREGKVRFLGFSAHHAEAALRLMDALALDSVLFPVNFNAWERGGFGPQILQKAKSKGMARLALKALAFGAWPKDLPRARRSYPKCWYEPVGEKDLAALALRFTLNQEITAAIPPGDERIFRLALDLAATPQQPLSKTELAMLKARAAEREPVFRA